MTLPAAQSAVVNNYGWRGDTSKMFSCSLCQYHTPDEEQIRKHFNGSEHKLIIKDLSYFFPRHKLDFLQEYFLYVKEEMSMQQKNSDMPPIRDKFRGIGQEHYVHRIQAAHCRACEVLIPDIPELLAAHITSPAHEENCKATSRTIKSNSLAVAKNFFQDKKIWQMSEKYLQEQKPIKEIIACLSHVNSTEDVLVAEKDDSSDEDAIAHLEVPANHNKDAMADAKAHPKVPGNRNEDVIGVDAKVPVILKQGPAQENKVYMQSTFKIPYKIKNQAMKKIVNRFQLTCSYCKFHTLYDEEMKRHLQSRFHEEVFYHIEEKFSKQAADFLQEEMLHWQKRIKKRSGPVEDLSTTIQEIYCNQDSTHRLSMEHFLEVETTRCVACNKIFPMCSSVLLQHIESPLHEQNSRILMEQSKEAALRTAKAMLNSEQKKRRLEQYMKQVKEEEDAPSGQDIAEDCDYACEALDYAEVDAPPYKKTKMA
ncbi:A-kinase anchor protein 8-like isoform X2 [Eleutherodactylus coqui]|uniref:A-kinase anchor protein 8-like isoform X2 n=1 Tax=Eleutherodactylus coqui TaxID=57060 RepID=UPI0034633E92